jgi:phospholipid transport system substrate-binding protein
MLNIATTQPVDFRYRLKRVLIPVITVLALSLLAPISTAATDSATQVVEKLHAELLAVMKQADKLGYEGRYQRLAPVIATSYDFPYVAKVAVGRYWRSFSAEEQSQFVETFSKLSIATYARRFDGYSGERFKTISNKELRKGRVVVKTILVKANGEEIELDYILHQLNKQWRIINVVAEGVSDLSLKRADYTSYLKTKGFDALLRKLNEKIQQYAG